MDAKYDPVQAEEARLWIQDVTGEEFQDYAADLKDGKILCKLINILRPGSVKKINESKMAFKMVGFHVASAISYNTTAHKLRTTFNLVKIFQL